MYRTVLLPTDGSPVSRKAVKQGIAFAKSIGAKVVGFFSPAGLSTRMYREYVAPAALPVSGRVRGGGQGGRAKATRFIEQAAAQAGVRYEGVYKVSYAPWEAIIEAAKKKKCDLIFMGSHGRRGLAGVVLGSQTTKVLTHSKIPVLVAR